MEACRNEAHCFFRPLVAGQWRLSRNPDPLVAEFKSAAVRYLIFDALYILGCKHFSYVGAISDVGSKRELISLHPMGVSSVDTLASLR